MIPLPDGLRSALDEREIVSRRSDKVGPVQAVATGPNQTVVPTGPEDIRADLEAACAAFQAHIDAATALGGQVTLIAGVTEAARLYAEILRIHPYEDGNARVSFIALQAALCSQGMYPVWFGDVERHDEALGWALRRDAIPNLEPLVQLIVERMRLAAAAVPGGIVEP